MVRALCLLPPVLFLLELVWGGPGTWASIGGLTVRKLLFAGSLLSLSVYAALRRRLGVHPADAALFLIIAVSILLWMGLIPLMRGRELDQTLADGDSLLLLLLYFPLAHLIRGGAISWPAVVRLLVWAVVPLCLVQVAIFLLVQWRPGLGTVFSIAGASLFGSEAIYVGPMPGGFYRVFWISSLYALFAFFLAQRWPAGSWKRSGLVLLFGAGILVAYSRAMWLAVVAGLLVIAVLRGPEHLLRGDLLVMKRGQLRGALVAGLGGMVVILLALRPSLELGERLVSILDAGDVSTAARMEQTGPLLDTWTTAPLLGIGFGGHARGFLRSEETPFSYELVGFALLMKVGILGILLLLIAASSVLWRAWRAGRPPDARRWLANWLALALSLFLVVQTNPYLFNFVGMSLVLFLLLDVVSAEERWTRLT